MIERSVLSMSRGPGLFRMAVNIALLTAWVCSLGVGVAVARQETGGEAAESGGDWTYELTEVLPQDPEVLTGQLENGLRYYVRGNGRPENRAFLRLIVRAGSVLEDDDQRGLAHFVEHMAFNGTRNFEKTELLDYLQGIGMRFGPDVNAYTSFDETVYMLEVPTDDPEILDTALLVLEDWASGVSLEDEEIENERGVVIEEWRGGRGAGARLRDAEIPYRFHGSRYAERLPIGDPEMLREAPPERLRDFYRDWYRPDLMAVIAVGDIEAAAIEAEVRRRFGKLEGPEQPRERFEAEIPSHEETLVSVFADPELPRSSISVAYKGPADPFVTVADYRARLVRGLYNGMLNNRLAERAEKADPPFIGATSSRGTLARTRSLYLLSAGAREGGAVRALEAVLTESERARRHGFEESELERAKVNTLRSMDRAYDERDKTHSGAYAGEYSRNFLTDEPFSGIAYERELARRYVPEIGLPEVNAAADSWIHDDDRVILASGPEKEGLEQPREEELLAVFDRVEQVEVVAYEDDVGEGALVPVRPSPGRIVERSTIEELEVTEWLLSNGIRVVLRPSDFKNDEILVASFSPGGISLVSDDDWLEANMATSVAQLSGFGNFSLTQLNKALAGKVARVGPVIGPLFEGISGRGSPKDLETLFELIYLGGTSPRRDAEAYESFLTRQGALLRNQSAMPRYAFFKTLAEIATQAHPRRRLITEEMLAELDQDRIFAVYEDRFRDFSRLHVLLRRQLRARRDRTPGGDLARGPSVHGPRGSLERRRREDAGGAHRTDCVQGPGGAEPGRVGVQRPLRADPVEPLPAERDGLAAAGPPAGAPAGGTWWHLRGERVRRRGQDPGFDICGPDQLRLRSRPGRGDARGGRRGGCQDPHRPGHGRRDCSDPGAATARPGDGEGDQRLLVGRAADRVPIRRGSSQHPGVRRTVRPARRGHDPRRRP